MPPEVRPTPMPFILEEGAEFVGFQTQQRAWRMAVVKKWRWLLEGKRHGLKEIPRRLWEPMAIMFENQQQVCRETRFALEATTKTDVTLPEKYALPIIRNVYPQLIASKIASIQPMPRMSGGVARVFYQDFLREDVAPDTSLTILDSDYALGAEDSVPKRIKMTIEAITITAIKDILGASWSTEVQEDAQGALGIDVEAELVAQMSGEILREIDQRILAEILAGATAGNTTWNWTVPAGYTTKEWYETLGHALIDAEDLIYGTRFRQADYLICGRNLTKYIRKMQDFKPEPRNQPGDEPFAMGVELTGRITGFWDVYTTVFLPTNRGIMGRYPRSQTDTGYIYAPYIPLAPMPLVYAEYVYAPGTDVHGMYRNVDKWSRNVRTRYGKAMVVGDLFTTLTIAA